MNCPIESRNPEMLVDHANGKLDLATARGLEQHLAGCSACQEVVVRQAAIWRALDTWEAAPISPDFDRRLYRRIDEEVNSSWWERAMRPFRTMPLRHALPLTETAGLLLMAGVLLQNPGHVAPATPHNELVRANQVERTLDDLDLLRQFSAADSAESTHHDAM